MKINYDAVIATHFTGGTSALVFWSFRYFLGRRTGATCEFAEQLAAAWDLLYDGDKSLIIKELNEAFERDDKMRADPVCSSEYYPLGHDCDRAAWELVRAKYLAKVS